MFVVFHLFFFSKNRTRQRTLRCSVCLVFIYNISLMHFELRHLNCCCIEDAGSNAASPIVTYATILQGGYLRWNDKDNTFLADANKQRAILQCFIIMITYCPILNYHSVLYCHTNEVPIATLFTCVYFSLLFQWLSMCILERILK